MSKEEAYIKIMDTNPNRFDKLFSTMFDLWALSDNTIREFGKERFIKTANECLLESIIKDIKKDE